MRAPVARCRVAHPRAVTEAFTARPPATHPAPPAATRASAARPARRGGNAGPGDAGPDAGPTCVNVPCQGFGRREPDLPVGDSPYGMRSRRGGPEHGLRFGVPVRMPDRRSSACRARARPATAWWIRTALGQTPDKSLWPLHAVHLRRVHDQHTMPDRLPTPNSVCTTASGTTDGGLTLVPGACVVDLCTVGQYGTHSPYNPADICCASADSSVTAYVQGACCTSNDCGDGGAGLACQGNVCTQCSAVTGNTFYVDPVNGSDTQGTGAGVSDGAEHARSRPSVARSR